MHWTLWVLPPSQTFREYVASSFLCSQGESTPTQRHGLQDQSAIPLGYASGMMTQTVETVE